MAFIGTRRVIRSCTRTDPFMDDRGIPHALTHRVMLLYRLAVRRRLLAANAVALTKHPNGVDVRRTVRELQARLDEAEEVLRAIRAGHVDALVVSGPDGDQVYTLTGAEHPYRVLVEAISEGAVMLNASGTIF